MIKKFRLLLYTFSILFSQTNVSADIENITNQNHFIAYEDPRNYNYSLTQKESEIIDSLNNSYIQDKFFYRRLSDAEIIFNANILSNKIELLEKKLSRMTCPEKLLCTLVAIVALSASTLWAIKGGGVLHEMYTEFMLKNFKDVYFEEDVIKRLSSITINQEEKDYLDTFSFENIHCRYVINPYSPTTRITDPKTGRSQVFWQDDIIKNKIANLSPMEKEKIRYVALRSTINDLKLQIPALSLISITPILISVAGSIEFLKTLIDDKNTQSKFENHKKIYRLLKEEQKRRNL